MSERNHAPRQITVHRLGPQAYRLTWTCQGRWVEQIRHTDATPREIKAEIPQDPDCAGCQHAGEGA